ncbi:MAG TPA: hypothetical protein VNH18_03810 [Bryobacteraceae bacterium]|nr:hypothetical protein [Bryobacteraceae bacterium]
MSKILVPIGYGDFRLALDPKPELVQVVNGNRPVSHPVDEMLSDGRGKFVPAIDLRH